MNTPMEQPRHGPCVIIQYAPKPWDRGKEPLTRTVEVPSGLALDQVEKWLREKLLMKPGERIVGQPTRAGKGGAQ